MYQSMTSSLKAKYDAFNKLNESYNIKIKTKRLLFYKFKVCSS